LLAVTGVSETETAYKPTLRIVSRDSSMQRAIVVVVVTLLAVSFVGLTLYFVTEDFGSGRGHGAQMTTDAGVSRSLWLLVFAVPLAVAAVVAVYGVLFPPIKTQKTPKTIEQTSLPVAPAQPSEPTAQDSSQRLDAVLRILNEDERKIIEVLAAAPDGTMLQRDIRWKAGLTRVKTHRVLVRLAARGIVNVEKYYNTKKVTLSDWITQNRKT
jgi:uncharacterized membrane protein